MQVCLGKIPAKMSSSLTYCHNHRKYCEHSYIINCEIMVKNLNPTYTLN